MTGRSSQALRTPADPYLSFAFLCQQVLIEKDGAHSFIRIIDRLTHAEHGPAAPPEMPAFKYSLVLALGFRAGSARGNNEIRVALERPSGITETLPFTLPVHFEGEERGAFFTVNLPDMEFPDQGLYWFIIRLSGQFVTRVPLRIVYQRYAP